jgi:hypothetical protein
MATIIKIVYDVTNPVIKVTYDVTNITVSGSDIAPVYISLDYSSSSAVTVITSVGLTMPTGFSVANSPLTSSGTLAVTYAAGYSLPTTTKQSEWDQAYNDKINSAAVTGTTTKTLTLNQQDGGTIQASWSDIDTGLTSVGVSMPSGFTVANSPLTSNGTINITGSGTTAQYLRGDGTLATFPTIYNGTVTSVDMTVPTGLTISGNPITSAGTLALALASGYSIPTTASQANWNTAYNDSITSASVSGTSTKTLTLNQQDGGTVTASWSDIDTGLTSVGLSMPSAFAVANSPLTSNGTIAVTGAGTSAQYVRGDGQLANFPANGGGGSSVNYYLNGSVSQGTFGGDTYYEMSKSPIGGAGTNFTRTAAQGNGYIASFITDAGDPALLNIPGGNWNLEFYFNASSGGGTPSFYAELYKVSSSNVFTLVASGSTNAEGITQGTVVDQYFTSIPVVQTSLLATDRLAIRIYVLPDGRNITLHTENSNLCEVLTTFSTGLNALNGLTAQVQYFATGTSGTDFNISSVTDTHTFNLPDASSSARGLVTTGTQTVAGAKTFSSAVTSTNFVLSGGTGNTGLYYGHTNKVVLANYVVGGGIDFETNGGVINMVLDASGNLDVVGNVTGASIIKSGGTSSQFLKADGSVDSTTYQSALTLTTTGTSGAATLVGSTLNIPQYSGTNIYNGDGTLTGNRSLTHGGYNLSFIGSSFTNRFTSAGRLLLGTTTESTYIFDAVGAARVSGDLAITRQAGGGGGSSVQNYFPSATGTDGLSYGVGKSETAGNSAFFGWRNNSGSPHTFLETYAGTGELRIQNVNASGTIKIGETNQTVSITGTNTLTLTGKYFSITDAASSVTFKNYSSGLSGTEAISYGVGKSETSGNTGFFGWANNSGTPFVYLESYGGGSPVCLQRGGGNVLVGTTSDISSSVFTIASTTKGFLPPRMTTTQRNAISSPAAGLIVYDNTLNDLVYHNGTAWTIIQDAITLTTTGSSGAATLVGTTLNIPNYGSALSGYLPLTGGTLSSASSAETLRLVNTGTGYGLYNQSDSYFQGDVKFQSVSNTILKVDASNKLIAAVAGTDYQAPITNPVTGTGTTNYLPKWTSGSAIGSSAIYDNIGNIIIGSTTDNGQKLQVVGTGYFSGNVSIGTTSPLYKLDVQGQTRIGYDVTPAAPSATDILSTAHTIFGGNGGNYLTIGQYGSPTYAQWIQSSFSNPTSAVYSLLLNPLGGNLLVGTTTDSGEKLQVAGTMKVGGESSFNTTTNQFAIFNSTNADGGVIVFRRSGTNVGAIGNSKNLGVGVLDDLEIRSGISASIHLKTDSGSITVKSSGIVNLSNVPSSATGLSSGDIYKDASGFLKIV